MDDTWGSTTYFFMHTLFRASTEAATLHTFTPRDCLSWADVGFVCPPESEDLIKSEETHHFIWLCLLFGLALIQ